MDRRVLLIDDDRKLQKLLAEYLSGYGYGVHGRTDGLDACAAVRETEPDLVILDVMMPGRDGIEVLRDIRRESSVPVIMLTAKGDDSDRIVGLELGADDYVSKPFNPRELLARMKAVLRRADGRGAASSRQTVIESGGLVLDVSRRVLTIGESELALPQTECRLLEVLMDRSGEVLSRDELMDQVWGKAFMANDRSIDVHVSKLRTALKSHAAHADRIQTVWGTGYRFRSEP